MIVSVDKGLVTTLTTATEKEDVYAFTFGQKDLMAGLSIQGSKITRMNNIDICFTGNCKAIVKKPRKRPIYLYDNSM